ncbi:unnamed protein product [Rotaria socialis]|uniref:Dienelactone hydrolase domain-containing protein n=3 Tax=Rotaria socialis TaxID=392032 RepID=A0A820U8N9_9BILA|nr:unnamed protein product [Rotaria socialis]CAF3309928.1 unnamed protein product [Rotaria socialis]CAF3674960.1 unnamed protein product [Rotaria socialis]CAF4481170.1 unnamed protein product [Rotaria socialis]CAF4652604.1 unnamed protein product [Rotaria socialis]
MSSPCCVDPGVKQIYQAQGYEKEIAGVNSYVTGEGKSAIIIFTDVFGNSFVNVRKLADTFAQSCQVTVLIPDYFNQDSMDPDDPNLWDLLPNWLKKHPPTYACSIGEKFISTIKSNYQSIQVIGFCYGAKVVIDLITHNELSSLVKAAIVAHPSFLVKEEATQIKRPILFLCAENDSLFTSDLRQEFEKELKSNGLGTFIEYPGTVHGFVVRPDNTEQVIQEKDKAVQDAIEFFKRNI